MGMPRPQKNENRSGERPGHQAEMQASMSSEYIPSMTMTISLYKTLYSLGKACGRN
jgi:hypothetical protein